MIQNLIPPRTKRFEEWFTGGFHIYPSWDIPTRIHYDANPYVIDFYKSDPIKLRLELSKRPATYAHFHQTLNIPEMERTVADWAVVWQQQRGGEAGCTTGSRKAYYGFRPESWLPWVNRLPDSFARFRNATFVCQRCEHNEFVDEDDSVIYADPPYLLSKRVIYEHEMTVAQHVALAIQLHQYRRTKVILSYADHPMIRYLYRDWRCYNMTQTKCMGSSTTPLYDLIFTNRD